MGTPVLRPGVSARSYRHADSEVDSNNRRFAGLLVTGCMQLEESQSQSCLIHLVRSASKQPRVTIELPIHPMSQPAEECSLLAASRLREGRVRDPVDLARVMPLARAEGR
jgi:hypothetical protein